MKVLTFNCGTDSIRFKVVETISQQILVKGAVEAISTENAFFDFHNFRDSKQFKKPYNKGFDSAVDEILCTLTDDWYGIFSSIGEIDAIGHRIVHGGKKYVEPIIIKDEILSDLKSMEQIDPVHNSKITKVIEICKNEVNNQIYNVGVFDTAFHQTIPKINSMYAIPRELYEKAGVQKYGFHGISYQNIMRQLPDLIDKNPEEINAILIQLGSGSSMCCVKDGKSFDTTMGYSPLDGMVMSTRSGSIDPTILTKICDYYHCNLNEALNILNYQSGYYGLCGESDIKTLCDKSENGDENAMFARQLAAQNFKKNLASMLVQLDSADAIVVSGGMGLRNSRQRDLFFSDLEMLGIMLDKDKNNKAFNEIATISTPGSKIPIMTVPSDEEMEISLQTEKLLGGR